MEIEDLRLKIDLPLLLPSSSFLLLPPSSFFSLSSLVFLPSFREFIIRKQEQPVGFVSHFIGCLVVALVGTSNETHHSVLARKWQKSSMREKIMDDKVQNPVNGNTHPEAKPWIPKRII